MFFAKTRIGAFEIAHNFIHDRRGEYVFIRVDPCKVSGRIRPDSEYDHGLWTAMDVPSEAIFGVEIVDEDFFESHEFLAYMGVGEEGQPENPS